MQEGRASRTAEIVCVARAIAHRDGRVPGFSDPTAMALLREEDRARVQEVAEGRPPATIRGRMQRRFLEPRVHMMALRTVAIDDAIRAAAAPQVVILGAGLDGRAFRMPELAGVRVFEVDHPDSQREKIARAAALVPLARDLRFVAVDFTRDSLDEKLAAAGHDPALPTTWVWEGVVMYLTRADVEATLAVIARRSAGGSRLIIAYAAPGPVVPLVKLFVQRAGEPFQSVFTAAAMRVLLAAHGFSVQRDDDIPTLARARAPSVYAETRSLGHVRIVVADGPGGGDSG